MAVFRYRVGAMSNPATGRGSCSTKVPKPSLSTRWQAGEFLALERLYAANFRRSLAGLDLRGQREALRSFGVDGKVVNSLDDAKAIATEIVTGEDKRLERLRVAAMFFNVPQHLHEPILQRWHEIGRPSLPGFAPYTAFALTIELFFQMALAGDLISTERPSNRMDIAYLFYLPFCQVFISGDRLHRRCAPLFVRDDQEFVWGPDLKSRSCADERPLPRFARIGARTGAHDLCERPTQDRGLPHRPYL